jgi:hypothetical protein
MIEMLTKSADVVEYIEAATHEDSPAQETPGLKTLREGDEPGIAPLDRVGELPTE